jgi:hypothetical protein
MRTLRANAGRQRACRRRVGSNNGCPAGSGGLDFKVAFGCPVQVVNDAAIPPLARASLSWATRNGKYQPKRALVENAAAFGRPQWRQRAVSRLPSQPSSAVTFELASSVEHLERESAAKLSQIYERLDRIEHPIAAPPAASPPRATVARKRVHRWHSDAFDPYQNPDAHIRRAFLHQPAGSRSACQHWRELCSPVWWHVPPCMRCPWSGPVPSTFSRSTAPQAP